MGKSRAILSLAVILSFRMLGLFMIFPVFSIYAPQFKHASPSLIGIALGAYGLTQSLLQLPLSALSDRIGRKPVIIGGLIVFACGSILAALTQNIYLLILGRALQGSGAIGSTIMASTADLTSLEERTKAMAILGMTIGLSFGLGMILGPLISTWFYLSGIFWSTAIFAVTGIFIYHFFVPNNQGQIRQHHHEAIIKTIKTLLIQKQLIKINISIFILHALFTASFVAIPLVLTSIKISPANQWQIYLPLLLCAFIMTFPILMFAEKKNKVKESLLLGIMLIAISESLLFTYSHLTACIVIALGLFFTGFTFLEALLPSLISKLAPPQHKGSVMGIFSSFQFFGIFVGGATAGLIEGHYDSLSIFSSCFLLCIFWMIFLAIKTPISFSPQEKIVSRPS